MTAKVIDGRQVFASVKAVAKAEATLGVIAALHEPCRCADDCPFCMSCGHRDEFWPCPQRHLIDECLGEQRVNRVISTMRGVLPGASVYSLQGDLR